MLEAVRQAKIPGDYVVSVADFGADLGQFADLPIGPQRLKMMLDWPTGIARSTSWWWAIRAAGRLSLPLS